MKNRKSAQSAREALTNMKRTTHNLSKVAAMLTLLLFALSGFFSVAAFAEGGAKETPDVKSEPDTFDGTWSPSKAKKEFILGNPEAQRNDTFGGRNKVHNADDGETGPFQIGRCTNQGCVWPEIVTPFPTGADERTAATIHEIEAISGVNNPKFGAMPLTAIGAALIANASAHLEATYESDPENAIPRAKEEQNQANQSSADTNAAMERNQAGAAIDFTSHYLYNFTVEANNKWNKVRNELFMPMALLLLLPGVVLAQLKATVAAGTPVIADVTSPFDGILRAIVGIFLIPATYLFINYGIDVSNSITYTIAHEYKRIFGTDMYKDAMCAHIRAFPYRGVSENFGYVPNLQAKMGPLGAPRGVQGKEFAKFEGENLEVALHDPCAKLDKVPEDRSNETVPHVVNAQRNSYNTVNSALAMTWNILCAFQMAYLYYLWFVGPVIAALWVYPMKELRDAFPSWINGVCTLCFWSLFWNTTILLMACCRGVDETGTLIMSALNFLTTACVKFAFDFAGLVKEAGAQAAKMAEQGGAKGGAAGAAGKAGADGKGAQMPSYVNNHTAAPGGNNPVPTGQPTTIASASPGGPNAVDSAVFTPTSDARTRSLATASPGDAGAINPDVNVDVGLPPGSSGAHGMRHMLGSHLGHFSVPFMGGNGVDGGLGLGIAGADGADGGDGGDGGDGSGTPFAFGDINDIDITNASLGSIGAAGLATFGLTSGVGQVGYGGNGQPAIGGGGDTNHNHQFAYHLNGDQIQALFQSNSQAAQQARAELLAQAQAAGGVYLGGAQGSNQGAFVTADQLGKAFGAIPGADGGGGSGPAGSNINIAQLLGDAGVPNVSATLASLGVSSITGGGTGGIDPVTGMPMTGGNGSQPIDPSRISVGLPPSEVTGLGNNGQGGGQILNMGDAMTAAQAQQRQQQEQTLSMLRESVASQFQAQQAAAANGTLGAQGDPAYANTALYANSANGLTVNGVATGQPTPEQVAQAQQMALSTPEGQRWLAQQSALAAGDVTAAGGGNNPLSTPGDAAIAEFSKQLAGLPAVGPADVGANIAGIGASGLMPGGGNGAYLAAASADQVNIAGTAGRIGDPNVTAPNALPNVVTSSGGGGDGLNSFLGINSNNAELARASDQPSTMDKLNQGIRQNYDQYNEQITRADPGIVSSMRASVDGSVGAAGTALNDQMGSGVTSLPTSANAQYADASYSGGGTSPYYTASADNYVVSQPQSSNYQQTPTGGGGDAFARAGNDQIAASNPMADQQIQEFAQQLASTPEVQGANLAQSVDGASYAMADSGVGSGGLISQVYSQSSASAAAGAEAAGLAAAGNAFLQGMQPGQPQVNNQLPTNQLPQQPQYNVNQPQQPQQPLQGQTYYARETGASGSNVPTGGLMPVPGGGRYGKVSTNRADALNKATQKNLAKDVADKSGKSANKLNSALGRAASKTTDPKKPGAAGPTTGGGANRKAVSDPMGSVASGSTLRRLRQKRKWSADEIEAMKRLAGGTGEQDNQNNQNGDWDM